MPKKVEPQSAAMAQAFDEQLARTGIQIEDQGAFELQLRTTLELHKAQLLAAIPELTAGNIIEYTAAVAAAICDEAMRPEIGRAMLYAAQLALAARSIHE
jgi:hypothetical protein